MATDIVQMDLALSNSDSSDTLGSFGKSRKKKKKRKNKDDQQGSESCEVALEDGRDNEEVSASKRKKMASQQEQDFPGNQEDFVNGDEDQVGLNEGTNQRQRLYFPNDVQMDYNSKVQWAFKLYTEHPGFEVLFKEGKFREYITVKDESAVEHLTSLGFAGVVLERPREDEKTTKIIIFGIPLCLDPDLLLNNERIVKARRREVKSGGKAFPKPQLIAFLKGDVPEKIFVPCIGYKKVAVFEEQEPLCFKCSKWGHRAYKCQYETRCRYCSKSHDSTECFNKIKDNVKIVPKCCNCGGDHNANSRLCKRRPAVKLPGKISTL